MKTASVVFFYFGEASYVNRLAQETMSLRPALEGRDRSVLLHHETRAAGLAVSDEDARWATVVDAPTTDNLVRHLVELGRDGYVVDLFVFSHGTNNAFLASRGTYGDSVGLHGSTLELRVPKLDLRAVWQCNCYGQTLNDTWRRLGARVAAGSRFVDFYPTRWRRFAELWHGGAAFGDAVRLSDTALVRTPVQAYILGDAAARRSEWDGSLLEAATVLGGGAAAERYFRRCWLGADWTEGLSGKQNMNRSSGMVVDGDRSVVFG